MQRTGNLCYGGSNQSVVDYARAFNWDAARLAQCFNGMPLDVAQGLLKYQLDFQDDVVVTVPFHKYARRYALVLVSKISMPEHTKECEPIPNLPYGYNIRESAFSALVFLH